MFKPDLELTEEQLAEKYGNEHPGFDKAAWKVAVRDELTLVGYWEWVHNQLVYQERNRQHFATAVRSAITLSCQAAPKQGLDALSTKIAEQFSKLSLYDSVLVAKLFPQMLPVVMQWLSQRVAIKLGITQTEDQPNG